MSQLPRNNDADERMEYKVLRMTKLPKHWNVDEIKAYVASLGINAEDIRKILHPLENNDAVIEVSADISTDWICQQKHKIGKHKIEIKSQEKQRLGVVAVTLTKDLSNLVDSDPDLLEKLQLQVDADVQYNEKAQAYIFESNWYSMEWVMEHLQRLQDQSMATAKSSSESDTDQILDLKQTVRGLSGKTFNLGNHKSWSADDPLYDVAKKKRGAHEFKFDSFLNTKDLTSQATSTLFQKPQRKQSKKTNEGFDASLYLNGPTTYNFDIATLHVFVGEGDIILEESDAIVSPISMDLTKPYGISHLIAQCVGPSLTRELEEKFEGMGPSVSQVVHTQAGGQLNKQISRIIHCVLPEYFSLNEEEAAHQLTCAYLNCLHMADQKLWLHSLSMPLLATGGAQGFPIDLSIGCFYDAVLLFVLRERQTWHLQDVRLVCNNVDTATASIMILISLMDMDRQKMTDAALEKYQENSQQYGLFADIFPESGVSEQKIVEISKNFQPLNKHPGENRAVFENLKKRTGDQTKHWDVSLEDVAQGKTISRHNYDQSDEQEDVVDDVHVDKIDADLTDKLGVGLSKLEFESKNFPKNHGEGGTGYEPDDDWNAEQKSNKESRDVPRYDAQHKQAFKHNEENDGQNSEKEDMPEDDDKSETSQKPEDVDKDEQKSENDDGVERGSDPTKETDHDDKAADGDADDEEEEDDDDDSVAEKEEEKGNGNDDDADTVSKKDENDDEDDGDENDEEEEEEEERMDDEQEDGDDDDRQEGEKEATGDTHYKHGQVKGDEKETGSDMFQDDVGE